MGRIGRRIEERRTEVRNKKIKKGQKWRGTKEEQRNKKKERKRKGKKGKIRRQPGKFELLVGVGETETWPLTSHTN